MAQLVDFTQFKSAYINDRKEFFRLSDEERARRRGEYIAALEKSTTLYVGNISFFTTETQVHEIFSRCGVVKQIIMGLDRIHKTPCGFCFVEFEKREEAEDAMKYLNQVGAGKGRLLRVVGCVCVCVSGGVVGVVVLDCGMVWRGVRGGLLRDAKRCTWLCMAEGGCRELSRDGDDDFVFFFVGKIFFVGEKRKEMCL